MTPEQEERLVTAIEGISTALTRIAGVEERISKRKYPERKTPDPATITRVKTEEDLAREDLGDTGEESLEDWLDINDIGPREREFIRRQQEIRRAADASAGRSESAEETGRPSTS